MSIPCGIRPWILHLHHHKDNAPPNFPFITDFSFVKFPSYSPSKSPNVAPDYSPSMAPTSPTSPPTIAPSDAPSRTPSLAPTLAPSLTPSHAPSLAPSLAPSYSPTACPDDNSRVLSNDGIDLIANKTKEISRIFSSIVNISELLMHLDDDYSIDFDKKCKLN